MENFLNELEAAATAKLIPMFCCPKGGTVYNPEKHKEVHTTNLGISFAATWLQKKGFERQEYETTQGRATNWDVLVHGDEQVHLYEHKN